MSASSGPYSLPGVTGATTRKVTLTEARAIASGALTHNEERRAALAAALETSDPDNPGPFVAPFRQLITGIHQFGKHWSWRCGILGSLPTQEREAAGCRYDQVTDSWEALVEEATYHLRKYHGVVPLAPLGEVDEMRSVRDRALAEHARLYAEREVYRRLLRGMARRVRVARHHARVSALSWNSAIGALLAEIDRLRAALAAAATPAPPVDVAARLRAVAKILDDDVPFFGLDKVIEGLSVLAGCIEADPDDARSQAIARALTGEAT